MRIPQDTIDNILSRTDIISVIHERVPLKKHGKDYKACCPFHGEKTPSFSVSEQKQVYHCFGCKAGGNVISFLMQYDRLSFHECIEMLAHAAGVPLPKDMNNAEQAENTKVLYDIMARASEFYQEKLRSHPQAPTVIEYLKGRGLTGKICQRFGLGFAPPGWDNLLRQFRSDKQALTRAGLIIEKSADKQYDRFRERLMFPIRDHRARVIGFGGRVLKKEDGAKYLNSPETPIFHKSRALYGLYELLQCQSHPESVFIVEGYMDVIALAQHGIDNALATLGTATTAGHLKLIFRYCKRITFCFDGDAAGKRAAWRALENSLPQLTSGVEIKFLFLPDGDDPDSLVRNIGREAFLERATQAMTLEEFLFSSLSKNYDLHQLAPRAAFTEEMMTYLNQIPEGVYHTMLLDKLSFITKQPVEVLQKLHLTGLPKTHVPETPEETEATVADIILPHPRQSPTVYLCMLLLQAPQLATQLAPAIIEQVREAKLPGGKLLQGLHGALVADPSLHTALLLERCRNTPYFNALQTLASYEHGLAADNLAAELHHCVARLEKQFIEREIHQLMEKATHQQITEEEKVRLQSLIKQNKQASPA